MRPVLVLLAILVLVGRLFGPASPLSDEFGVASATTSFWLDGVPICHATQPGDAVDEPAPARPDGHRHDCLLCLACHVAGQVALPGPEHISLPAAPDRMVARAAVPPPATAPPRLIRLKSSPPTGPPAFSI